MSEVSDYPKNGPKVIADFVNSARVNPRILVSRGSVGTYVGQNGLVLNSAPNTPRIGYENGNGVGIILDQTSSNIFQSGNMAGFVAGIYPTGTGKFPGNGYSTTNAHGVTYSLVGTGVEDNIPYYDLRLYGTPTMEYMDAAFIIPPNNSIAGNYCSSAHIRLISGSPQDYYAYTSTWGSDSVTKYQQRLMLSDTVGKTLSSCRVVSVTALTDNVLFRGAYQIGIREGEYLDITLRVGGLQLEACAAPTSFIATAGSEVTRAGDRFIIDNVGGLFDSAEGTFFVDVDTFTPQTTFDLFTTHPNTQDNGHRIALVINSDNELYARCGSYERIQIADIGSFKKRLRAAITWKQGQPFTIACNGRTTTSLGNAVNQPFDKIGIGCNPMVGDVITNMIGSVRKFAYYERMLSIEELGIITSS